MGLLSRAYVQKQSEQLAAEAAVRMMLEQSTLQQTRAAMGTPAPKLDGGYYDEATNAYVDCYKVGDAIGTTDADSKPIAR